MVFAGYSRVSRVGRRAGDSFISPSVQRETIDRWAQAHGIEVRHYEDLDVSGGKMSRPQFDQAMALVESGELAGLVVAKLDRFGRSLVGALDAIRRIDEAGGKFVSVADSFDTATPTGRLLLKIMLSLAEWELDRIRDGWATAQEQAVARGVHISSQPPTGYIRDHDGRLIPHPEYAPLIGDLFRLKSAGSSWRELSQFLNDRGVIGPYGSPFWRTGATKHIIANKVYIGEARSGRFTNPDAHEALIDRSTWESAQATKGDITPRNVNGGALLSGIMRCAGCRYLMKGDMMKLRTGERARFYRCRGEHGAGICEDRSAVLGSVIEPYVTEQFLRAHSAYYGEMATDEDYAVAESELRAAETELAEYVANTALVSIIGADAFNLGARARQEMVIGARQSLSKLVPATALAINVGKAWEDSNVSQRRRLLSSTIDAVVLRSGKGIDISDRVVILTDGLDDSWPKRGRRLNGIVPFTDIPGAVV